MTAIDWTKVSSELRTALEKSLPTGKTIEDVRVVSASATLEIPSEQEQKLFRAEIEKAGGPSPITNGRPTIMRVVAWLAHEGINKNRLEFVKDDLTQAAAKITQPDFLPMDFNHSAFDSWGFAQKAIGVWYKAEMAQDPAANNAWGILAYGVMWSWMNPEIADRLLAEQARNGRIDFSMACICGKITEARNDDGPYETAGETTFFTLSALDVPPADPNATGLGIEGSEDTNLESDLKQRLLSKAAALQLSNLRTAQAQEKNMDELTATLKDLVEKLAKIDDASLKDTAAAINTKLGEIAASVKKVAELETSLADVTGKLTVATTELETTKTKLTEAEAKAATVSDKDTAIEAAKTELKAATDEVTRLTAELEASKTELKAFKDAEAAKAAADKAAARYAELPASYREAFEKKSTEDQDKAKTRWAALDDAAWTAFVADISVAPVRKSYLELSKTEKNIPSTAPDTSAVAGRLSKYTAR